MIIGQGVVKLTAKLVPDAILAVLTSRDDQVVGGAPIAGKHNTIVSFPVN